MMSPSSAYNYSKIDHHTGKDLDHPQAKVWGEGEEGGGGGGGGRGEEEWKTRRG